MTKKIVRNCLIVVLILFLCIALYQIVSFVRSSIMLKEVLSDKREHYSEEEIIQLFNENYDLFDEVSTILMENDDFRDKSTDKVGFSMISSPYDENMKLFSWGDKNDIKKMFELNAVSLVYDHEGFVKISFNGPEYSGHRRSLVFICWGDGEDVQGKESFIYQLENSFLNGGKVKTLDDRWLFYSY